MPLIQDSESVKLHWALWRLRLVTRRALGFSNPSQTRDADPTADRCHAASPDRPRKDADAVRINQRPSA
jgi:hypothetical protein